MDDDRTRKDDLPWWEEKIYWRRGWFRWSWELHETIKALRPDLRAPQRRNASLLISRLLNLARLKEVGSNRRLRSERAEAPWDGWMQCTTRYIQKGTDLAPWEQKAAFTVLEQLGWVLRVKRGVPPRRWVRVEFEALLRDLAEDRDRRNRDVEGRFS